MSLLAKIKSDIQRIGSEVGAIEAKFISTHSSAVLAVLTNIDSTAKNPLVEGFLSTILTPAIMKYYPSMESYLDKAIATVTVATSIATDVQNATTIEAKLAIFIADLNKTNVVIHSAILNALGEELLSIVDNKSLTTEVYQYYLLAEKILSKA